MTTDEYTKLISHGFDNKQINQLEILSVNTGLTIDMLCEKFNSKQHDDGLLRKLNCALKERTEEINKIIPQIFELIEKGIDFTPMLEFTEDYKVKIVFNMLSGDFSDEEVEQVVEVLKYKNVDEDVAKLIWEDVNEGVDTRNYLKENLTNDQIYLANSAYEMGYFDVLDVVDKIDDGYDDADAIHEALETGIDIVSLSHTQNPTLIYDIIECKKKGIDVDKFLDKYSKGFKLIYVEELIKKKYDDDKIRQMLEELPLHKFRVKDKLLPACIDLYEKGALVYKYLDHGGFDVDYYDKLIRIYDHLKKEDFPEFEKENSYYANYELNLMEEAIKYNREDLFKALVYVTDPNDMAYYAISLLLKKDDREGKTSPIVKLLYDKGSDVFNDYKPSFEFSSSQKEALSRMVQQGLSFEDIEVLRDANIGHRKMRVMGNMLEKGYDIKMLLENIDRLSDDEMQAVLTCMEAGLTVTDENLKDKGIEK